MTLHASFASMTYVAWVLLASSVAILVLAADNTWDVSSPDGSIKVTVALRNLGIDKPGHTDKERLYYRIRKDASTVVLDWSPLGVYVATSNDKTTSNPDLSFVDKLEFTEIVNNYRDEEVEYRLLHGKRLINIDHHSALGLRFSNPNMNFIDIVFKVFDDGVAFSYFFGGDGRTIIIGEETGFNMATADKPWLQDYDRNGWVSPAYEQLYKPRNIGEVSRVDGWCLPALFSMPDATDEPLFVLLAESGVTRDYLGVRLEAKPENGMKSMYKIRFPSKEEGDGVGETYVVSQKPFASSWRVILIGAANKIVESNLIMHVAPEQDSKLDTADLSWIKPGTATWSWWSQDVGQPSLQEEYIDSSSEFAWNYTLVDANWDRWPGAYDQVKSLVEYGREKNPPVGIWLWYNSGGPHNHITEGPKGLMHIRETRRMELEKIARLGVVGIKIDFWHSDKQDRMTQYLDVLDDALDYKIMVNFHGCTMPRGWERQYPNLMSMEANRGGEIYKGRDHSAPTASDNVMYTYTRNVVGSMDYTPLTFAAALQVHGITYSHTLALSVAFESSVQHWADQADANPDLGYRKLFSDFPFVKEYLRTLPTIWDDTILLSGHPSTHSVIARRNGDDWWIGGISSSRSNIPDSTGIAVKIDWIEFLSNGAEYTLYTIKAGANPDSLIELQSEIQVGTSRALELQMAPASGFILHLSARASPDELRPIVQRDTQGNNDDVDEPIKRNNKFRFKDLDQRWKPDVLLQQRILEKKQQLQQQQQQQQQNNFDDHAAENFGQAAAASDDASILTTTPYSHGPTLTSLSIGILVVVTLGYIWIKCVKPRVRFLSRRTISLPSYYVSAHAKET